MQRWPVGCRSVREGFATVVKGDLRTSRVLCSGCKSESAAHGCPVRRVQSPLEVISALWWSTGQVGRREGDYGTGGFTGGTGLLGTRPRTFGPGTGARRRGRAKRHALSPQPRPQRHVDAGSRLIGARREELGAAGSSAHISRAGQAVPAVVPCSRFANLDLQHAKSAMTQSVATRLSRSCLAFIMGAAVVLNACSSGVDSDTIPRDETTNVAQQGLGANGTACTAGAQCTTGSCADGVCCDTACSGSCAACSAVKKGSGVDGTCGTVANGNDPDNECATQGAASCGTTGTCNGAGACAIYASGTACGAASCTKDTQLANTCNGAGSCLPSTSIPCAPYMCAGTVCATSCTDDTQCTGTYFCGMSNNACQPDQGNGQTCTANSQCITGSCVDGVCCNTACAGLCSACSAVRKGSGVDGVCGAVSNGNDPDNECATSSASTCGTTGTCNGTGACALYASGTACGTATCANDTQLANTCNGAGSCLPSTSIPCAPYKCEGNVCATSCTDDTQCAGIYFCGTSNTCQPDQGNGQTCTANSQCASGSCADGVCCDTACSGSCAACSAVKKGSGVDGTCGTVANGNDPDNECATQGAASCGTTGTCNGAGACAIYASGTACGAASCTKDTQLANTCNGAGSCLPSTSIPCAPYMCAGTVCATSCTDDTQCTGTYFCGMSNNACQPDQDNGQTCTANSQCASGSCVDGVCCDTACQDVCMACSALKKGSGGDGVCGAVSNGNDPDTECDTASPSTCTTTGVCNGAGACSLYASGTACGAGSCTNGTHTAENCNGLGSCMPSASASCAPYKCANGTSCATSCAADSDCAAGNFCRTSDSSCQPVMATGAACTSDLQCNSGHCTDGLCCDTSCTNPCVACSAALKQGGIDGECGPAKTGTDPHSDCVDDGAASCNRDGQCNGGGACRLYAAGTSCGSSQCVGNAATGLICNGAGLCSANSTGADCAPYTCKAGSCANPCVDDTDCVTGLYCNALGACTTKGALGIACTGASQCASGTCSEGVCCDTSCAAPCMACTAALKQGGADGLCGPVAAGTDPHYGCMQEGPATCGHDGTCDGTGDCRYYAAGIACGAGTCLGNLVQAVECNGLGTCSAGSGGTDCSPYVCQQGSCSATCQTPADCVSGYRCDQGACVSMKVSGESCTTSAQCESGFCADGVCCGTACSGQCEACDESGAAGTCTVVTGAPRGSRPACAGSGPCAGTCNGFSPSCDYPGAVVACAAASCTADLLSGNTCDGAGTCTPKTGVPCAPYACDGTSACRSSCSSNEHCAAGYECAAGKCVTATVDGGGGTGGASPDAEGPEHDANVDAAGGQSGTAPAGNDDGGCAIRSAGTAGDATRNTMGLILASFLAAFRTARRKRTPGGDRV